MKRTNIIAAILLAITCVGCQFESSDTSLPQEEKLVAANDLITELCICHAVNPDGSVLLWGDRTDNGKFYAYAVRDTLGNLTAGDEIAIRYSETVREHADVRKEADYLLFYLKSDECTLLQIGPDIVNEACDGSRRDKYIKKYEAKDESAVENTADVSAPNTLPIVAVTQTPEALEDTDQSLIADQNQPVQTQVQEYTLDIDNTAITASEGIYHLECTQTQKNLRIRINAQTFTFSNRYKYCFAKTIFSVADNTVMCSTHSIPGMNDMLVYFNASDQLQAGLISKLESAPNDMYLITITPVSITTLK